MTDYRPEGFHDLTPHLTVKDGRAAIAFYEEAFGAETRLCLPGPGGRGVMHAQVRFGDSPVMLGEEFPGVTRAPDTLGGTPVRLALHVPDCDAAFRRAVEAGAEAVMPPTDQFWGSRHSMVRDPFGHEWEISTHQEDLTPEEISRRAEEWLASWKPPDAGGPGAGA